MLFQNNKKIKIVFLFQVASFWASWDSFYNECIKDDRLEIKMVLFDEEICEKSQMKTARVFLEKNNISFIEYKDYNIDKDCPDIWVMQTPYDEGHRPLELRSDYIKNKGIKIVYITYGIEISNTVESINAHFLKGVPQNAWKIYTFSLLIKKDYDKYISPEITRALGHPKFDGLYNKNNFPLPENIKQKANGRKIVLWKVHFPKIFSIPNTDKIHYVTPDFEEYKKFLNEIENHKDLFFIFMPHPKFFEIILEYNILNEQEIEEIKKKINSFDNLYMYLEDDYRPGILNVDCIIVSRSAIMVEVAVTEKPILYMYNKKNIEAMTDAISGLINTYYTGSTCEDMINFIEMFKRGEDIKKQERLSAIKKYIPFFDGNAGRRIKEDIISSFKNDKAEGRNEI